RGSTRPQPAAKPILLRFSDPVRVKGEENGPKQLHVFSGGCSFAVHAVLPWTVFLFQLAQVIHSAAGGRTIPLDEQKLVDWPTGRPYRGNVPAAPRCRPTGAGQEQPLLPSVVPHPDN